LGYLTLLEPNEKDLKKGVAIEQVAKTFRLMTTAPLIANIGFGKAKGMDLLRRGDANAIAYGSLYIANPDLVARFESDAPLSKPDPSTFYGAGPKSFTDYPALSAKDRAARHGPHKECPVQEHGGREHGADAWCRGRRPAG
jgi:N-ethylmaleimide reductase